MTKDEALKLALEALEALTNSLDYEDLLHDDQRNAFKQSCAAIIVMREALEQLAQQQEPWEHLKAYGYAPGGYMMTCRGCNTTVIDVDKRASRCKPCAIKAFTAQQQEPTKAMIDAAERIDWSDSDVRGNIINMWQAMCAAAPQPAQQQEPVAYIRKDQLQKAAQSPMLCEVTPEPRQDRIGIYTSSQPSKPWVGLTQEEIKKLDCLTIMWDDGESAEIYNIEDFAHAIEAKLREKNAQPIRPLTDEQIDRAIAELGLNYFADAANNRAVLRELCRKAAHGIKGDA